MLSINVSNFISIGSMKNNNSDLTLNSKILCKTPKADYYSCWAGHNFGRDDVTSRRAAGPIVYFSYIMWRAKLVDTG